jgi:WD40 repeat protein
LRDFEDWLRFVRTQTHVLSQRPALVFQQAANAPSGSAPARAAGGRGPSRARHRLWLRWVNKPAHFDPCLVTLTGHTQSVNACVWFPDGSRIVTCSDDKTLRLWDSESGAERMVLRGHLKEVGCCDVSTDGRRIVSGSCGKPVEPP